MRGLIWVAFMTSLVLNIFLSLLLLNPKNFQVLADSTLGFRVVMGMLVLVNFISTIGLFAKIEKHKYIKVS